LDERAKKISVKTLHALALSIVKHDPEGAGLPRLFELGISGRRRESLLEKALDSLRGTRDMPRQLLEPEKAWSAITHLKHSEPGRLIEEDGSPEVELCRTFDTLVRKEHAVLFDDLGVAALRLIRARPEFLELLQRRHRAVFVDEFQDVDSTQFQLLEELAARRPVLTVVGDDDQCIYTWRGADPSFLRSFETRFEGAQTAFLRHNHRSTRTVVEAARAVIDHNQVRIQKPLITANSEGDQRIRVWRLGGIQDEVARVVDAVSRLLQRGVSPGDVAVLARNNDMVQAFVMEMRTEGLPVHADNPFRSSAGVNLLNLMRTVAEGPGDMHFQACVNLGRRRVRKSIFRTIARGVAMRPESVEATLRDWATNPGEKDDPSLKSITDFLGAVDQARKAVLDATPLQILERLVDSIELPRTATGVTEHDALHSAVALALEIARRQGPATGLESWRNAISELDELRQDNDSLDDAVSALTVHKSKGLEFKHVFMMGVQGDKFPNLKFAEMDPTSMEEERRLFYVGLTRAKHSLTISNHALYGAGNRKGVDKDGFISEIPNHLLDG